MKSSIIITNSYSVSHSLPNPAG